MGDSGEIANILAANDGIITTAQALTAGLTHDQLRGRVRRREWFRLATRLYRSASHDFTEAAMVRAVVLALHGCADRTTAAWWHGMLETLPSPLTVSCASRPVTLDWAVSLTVVRRRHRSDAIVQVRGLPVTTKPLTALMAAADLPDGSTYLDRWLQTRQVTLADLQRALEAHAGIRGIVEARRLVQIASSDSESEAERLFVRLLSDRNVTGWVQQLPLGRWRLDFAWPDQQVAVEISGWAFHRDPRRRRNDLSKANYLEGVDWKELEYDWHMLNDSGADCVQEVIDLLNSRGGDIA
ncbi:hypothetical protein [Gordonia hydrophobica]|uniref:DUF559 domain-containing protein n=1 Tax=Gordonia hydrophobica TaxID=40516 RepID=A0ABZ2U6V8_9ACTN|nr:hypothetical protein [Gordonia hydrophobica]MBM7366165.1 very-short-patch-repair endonuclease [Gordonia hydrophobica]